VCVLRRHAVEHRSRPSKRVFRRARGRLRDPSAPGRERLAGRRRPGRHDAEVRRRRVPLGAASEFRIRFAFPSSHDEGAQSKRSPLQLNATGTGRYENWEGLGRYAIGSADSVEVALEQRRHKIVDLLNTDGRQDFFAYERNQVAEDIEFGLGWRHRWKNFELAGAVQTTRIEGRSETPLAKIVASGNIPGGRLELRTQQGSWTLFLLGRAVSGDLDVEESYVTNGRRTVKRTAWIQGLTLSVAKHSKKFDVALSGTYDRSRLPFVAMAITGSEQYAVDGGYHAESRTKQWLAELIIRHEVVPGVFPRFYFRFTHGSETVGLSDSNGVLAPISLQLIRGGQFPPVGSNPTAPEFGMGFGLEFGFKSIGGSN
jgi:hypothetical protein